MCNSNRFYSLIFKLCIIIVHILIICTSFLCTFDKYFLIFMAVELKHFFHPKCLEGVWFVKSVTQADFILYIHTLYYDCSYIEHVRSKFCAHLIIYF